MNQQWGRGEARPDLESQTWTASTSACTRALLTAAPGSAVAAGVEGSGPEHARGAVRAQAVGPADAGSFLREAPVQAGAKGLGPPPYPGSGWRSQVGSGQSLPPCLRPPLSLFWGWITKPLKRGAVREPARCRSQSQDVGSRPSHRSRCATWGCTSLGLSFSLV